jgi:hypothetical protein
MFRKTILALVATAGLTVAPGLGTGTADAHPPSYYHYHHCRPSCYPPVIITPVVVEPVVIVTPVCQQYVVYCRPSCNLPWQYAGTFNSRYAAEQTMRSYAYQGFESYVALQ